MTHTGRQTYSRRIKHQSPLSLRGSVPLEGRKAYHRQSHNGTCVVWPTKSPTQALSSSISNLSTPVLSYRNPPLRYSTCNFKKIAHGLCKLGQSSEVHIIWCSTSLTPRSTKPVIHLPKLNAPLCQAVVSATFIPHFVFEYHPFLTNPPTSTFTNLSEIIKTLYAMAQFRPANTVNSNIITGEMHMIGFCPGSDRGKSAGMHYFSIFCFTPFELISIALFWRNLCL